MRLAIPHPSALLPMATLRPLGLEPGRALANANPTPEQRELRRAEQFRYIAMNCAQAAAPESNSIGDERVGTHRAAH